MIMWCINKMKGDIFYNERLEKQLPVIVSQSGMNVYMQAVSS